MCVLIISVATAVKGLKNIKAVNVLVSEIYEASLPELIDNQKLLMNIENLRRYAEIAYVSDNAQIRRDARLNARELVSGSISLTSDELYSDSLLAARTIDSLVRVRNQRDQHQAGLKVALSSYLNAMTVFAYYLNQDNYTSSIYNFFLNYFMVKNEDLSEISSEEFQREVEAHIALLRKVHESTRSDLSHVDKKASDDALASLEASLEVIKTSVEAIKQLSGEMEIKWSEIDLLLKSMRDRVRLGTESSVRNMLYLIIDNTDDTLRASYFFFAVLIFVVIMGFILIHMAITKPLRFTTEKLDKLRAGKIIKDEPVIRIVEIKRLAALLDILSEHLSGLYIQTNYLEGEAARKNDLEELMKAVFNASLDGYVVWNKRAVEFVSPGTLNLLDLETVEEFTGSFERFGFSLSHLREMYYKSLDSGSEREESSLITKNSSFIPVELTYIPVEFRQNSCLLTYIRDLKQNKITETELRLAKDKAEVATQSKSNFLAAMSHELKSPMNGILGLTRLLLGTELTKFQRDYLYSVEESARALLGIIDNILDYSQLESGRLVMEGNEFSLEKILNDVVEFNQAQSTLRGIPIVVNLDPKRANLYLGDASKIYQVLNNLISNALKFTEKGFVSINVVEETLEASVSYVDDMLPKPEQVVFGDEESELDATNKEFQMILTDDLEEGKKVVLHFVVRDTGIGLSPEARRNLFNIFSIGDPSANRKHGGTGMGLALSKSMVKMMGGKIWCESGLGIGSAFHFTTVVTPKATVVKEEQSQKA
ncbi:MAG: hypothetical protein LBF22_04950 [Deltaproteobacteria bacterium]|nr:hypothetical protein [Deltaproteobacteria bacterium]